MGRLGKFSLCVRRTVSRTDRAGTFAKLCFHKTPVKVSSPPVHEISELEGEFDLENLRKLYIRDGADGEWKLSWWQIRKLVTEAKEARGGMGDSLICAIFLYPHGK
jgi:hypothetical protein